MTFFNHSDERCTSVFTLHMYWNRNTSIVIMTIPEIKFKSTTTYNSISRWSYSVHDDDDILILTGDLQRTAKHKWVKQRRIQQTLMRCYLNNSLACQNRVTYTDHTVHFCQSQKFYSCAKSNNVVSCWEVHKKKEILWNNVY